MAHGNFFYRLERTMDNDNLEALNLSLNMLAEEIQEAMIHQGFANTRGATADIVQMSFILDSKGHIAMINQKACSLLSARYEDLIGMPFGMLLSEDSRTLWNASWHIWQHEKIFDTALALTFKTMENLLIPNACYLSTFMGHKTERPKTLITVILHSKSQYELETDLKRRVIQFEHDRQSTHGPSLKPPRQKPRLSFDDIRKLREGHDFIINNLDKKLPSLKEFALQLGTNEFKLKYGFKELYGTSVHRFLLEERLRKSQLLIQYTDMPLKQIAYTVGFRSFPHFSKTFKNRFGYSPKVLRKKYVERHR